MIRTTTSSSSSVKPATGRRTRVSLGLMGIPSGVLCYFDFWRQKARAERIRPDCRRAALPRTVGQLAVRKPACGLKSRKYGIWSRPDPENKKAARSRLWKEDSEAG